jgi:CRP/FNR family transcriptional regulator, cyclic AMP receptor protein
MTLSLKLEPAQTVQIFQRQPDPKHFAAGEVIFAAGESGDYMYGVLEGTVDLLIDDRVAESIVAGDVFGAGAVIHPNGVRIYKAVAKTDCTLAYLDEPRLLFAVQETPMFALEVMRSYSERLHRAHKHPLDRA